MFHVMWRLTYVSCELDRGRYEDGNSGKASSALAATAHRHCPATYVTEYGKRTNCSRHSRSSQGSSRCAILTFEPQQAHCCIVNSNRFWAGAYWL